MPVVCLRRVEWFHACPGDAGVEEIVGFPAGVSGRGSGVGTLLGSRTATASFCGCGVVPPIVVALRVLFPWGVFGGARGGLRTG